MTRLWLLCCGLLQALAVTQGATITIPLNVVFSGAGPAGTAPWATAIFTDTAVPGQVELTMETNNLSAQEFITAWSFNVAPYPTTGLSISWVSGAVATFPAGSPGSDCCKADGDGYFDIEFNFPDKNSSSPDPRFLNGLTSVYTISAPGLSATYFDALSTSGQKGGLLTAAHVQGGSGGWITADPVPEPVEWVLIGSGLFALAIIVRRRESTT